MKLLFIALFVGGVLLLTRYLVARAKKDSISNASENGGQKC